MHRAWRRRSAQAAARVRRGRRLCAVVWPARARAWALVRVAPGSCANKSCASKNTSRVYTSRLLEAWLWFGRRTRGAARGECTAKTLSSYFLQCGQLKIGVAARHQARSLGTAVPRGRHDVDPHQVHGAGAWRHGWRRRGVPPNNSAPPDREDDGIGGWGNMKVGVHPRLGRESILCEKRRKRAEATSVGEHRTADAL